jgi:lactate dehydrogenase-like 2-hydroxyacid dehydrogenase
LPLTNETKGVINKKLLKCANKNLLLVNTSRGDLINEQDIYSALSENTIGGVAFDTWFKPPSRNKSLPSNYPFEKLANVVMSPHRAGFIEDELPHLEDVVSNLNAFACGEHITGIVDLDKGY